MVYCLNPSCNNPENPPQNQYCHGCGNLLKNTTKAYVFHQRYRVVQFLGQGGFGRTYKIEDLNFQRKPRVLKKFTAQGNGETLKKAKELFLREAQQLDELKHEQIPAIYDYIEEENLLYLVQEFIQGEDLLTELRKEGCFSEEKIQKLLYDLLPILYYIHSKKLLHRDIKPDNIMRRQQDGKLILIDFGGAKEIATTIGTSLYTSGYAAIEQMLGQANITSDLYSLGATCVRLLTGCLPPQTYADTDLIYNAVETRWMWKEHLQQQGRKISEELEQVLEKLLEQQSINRYQSAQEVLKALTEKRQNSQPYYQQISQKPASQNQVAAFPLVKWKWETVTLTVIPPRSSFLGFGRQENPKISLNKRECQGQYFTEVLETGVSLEIVLIPGGTFMMGAAKREKGATDYEYPQHRVSIQPFFMGKYPITQKQWKIIASLPKIERNLNPNPSHFKGDERPVERVSWDDAVEFCKRLSIKTGRDYSLPSEAQWEYATRAGTTTPFYFGETITGELANYNATYTYGDEPQGQYREQTTPVGQFPSNAFGLYDVHGNVLEWCLDDWHNSYEGAPTDGSARLDKNDNPSQFKCLRGGAWNYNPRFCRSANRNRLNSVSVNYNYGFRVVLVGAGL